MIVITTINGKFTSCLPILQLTITLADALLLDHITPLLHLRSQELPFGAADFAYTHPSLR
jgi:hypothetical protein